MKIFLLDVFYENQDSFSVIKILAKKNKEKIILEDKSFHPYFFVKAEKVFEKALEENKNYFLKYEKKASEYKIYFKNTNQLIDFRHIVKELPGFIEKYEYDIAFDIRYMLDKKISPLHFYEVDENFNFKETKGNASLSYIALDIETINNEIISAALYSKNEKIVFTDKASKYKAKYLRNEKEIIKNVFDVISKYDIVLSYNGDNFDLPILLKKAKQYNLKNIPKAVIRKTSMGKSSLLKEIQHIDVYKMLLYLQHMGSISLEKLDLTNAYEKLIGKDKLELSYEEMPEIWSNIDNRHIILEYNLDDSKACFELFEKYKHLFLELSKIIHRSLQDSIRMSASNMIEAILMHEFKKHNKKIPKKPIGAVIMQRYQKSYEGAFVKEPKPGIYENIAVLDFRSLHPSIIISHKISPETIIKSNEKCKHRIISPSKDIFCQDKESIICNVLKKILDARISIKKELKKNFDDLLYARQWGLKRLLASFYGYFAYPRARWYCLECSRSVVAFSQKYIKYVAEEAEKRGFEVLYSDTDSAFLKYKNKKDVEKFLKKINKSLPGVIELSLEGYYKRALFVSKKSSERGAKKRYALIKEDSSLKIVGFEFVRRDWSNIAKKLQKEVLEIILKEGDLEKAIKKVREYIKKIEERKIDLKDLIIKSKITKSLNSYNANAPHISAARKAKRKGEIIKPGQIIEYIITNKGESISEKAELAKFVKKDQYDIDYYIEKQILPAVLPLIEQLGISKERIIEKSKQTKLF